MTDDSRFIPITRPSLGEPEAGAARRAILSGWVTQGPEVAAFEREFADFVGAPHACAVSSCTAALHLALLAVGVGPGDEVITVSHSFIATANSVRQCGAVPVFVDILPDSFNVDSKQIEERITARTRAILCVHQMGMPCDLEAILGIARAHGLRVVEDAACAVGSEILWDGRWERVGRPHSDVACFSFHPRKVITTGDGGMITTEDPDCDRRLRLWRHQGMSQSDAERHHSPRVIFEAYPVIGFNYRLTDIQAAVGREQLRRLPELVDRRRELARRYGDLLASIPGIRTPAEAPFARSNWQSYCIRLPEGCEQRSVMQSMLDRGVATRRGIQCIHREAAYADVVLRAPLSESEAAQDHCVLLPLYPDLTESEQSRVVAALEQACRKP